MLGFALVADPRGSMVWSRPGTVRPLQHQDMRRGKMKHMYLFVVVVSLMIVTGTGQAWGDGTHGTKIEVSYGSGGTHIARLNVDTYNGTDGSCFLPHKSYKIHDGESKIVKCHGKGKNRCFVALRLKYGETGITLRACKLVDDHKLISVYCSDSYPLGGISCTVSVGDRS